jgi:hypothetical protein
MAAITLQAPADPDRKPNMNEPEFSSYRQALEMVGISLHPALARMRRQGLWGMYATRTIARGDVLARCPFEALIPHDDARYPAGTSLSAKRIHTAARARQEGRSNRYHLYFELFETLAAMRDYSSYFCTAEQLQLLSSMSPLLADAIARDNLSKRTLATSIAAFDPGLDPDLITETMLNYASRGVGDAGFVPLLECFNHSGVNGAYILSRDGWVTLSARVDLAEGEQAFISYGDLDLLDHAIFYNYFDPGNDHLLRFGRREVFPIDAPAGLALHQRLSSRYPLGILELAGKRVLVFKDGRLLLSARGPSQAMMQFFVDFGVRSNEYRSARQIACETLSGWLDALTRHNRVEQFPNNPLPAGLSRFYPVLKKELELAAKARDWLAAQG